MELKSMSEQLNNLENNALKKMFQVMEALSGIEENGMVNFGGNSYNYMTAKQVMSHVAPLMKQFKLLVVLHEVNRFEVVEQKKFDRAGKESLTYLTNAIFTYRFVCPETGHYYDVPVATSGQDGSDKGIFKASTTALRPVLKQTFLITAGEDLDVEATDDTGQPTGSTAITHIVHAVKKIFADANLDLNNKTFKTLVRDYEVPLDDTLEQTSDMKKALNRFAQIARDYKSGVQLEDAIMSYRVKENELRSK
jgi:hypothetical protein